MWCVARWVWRVLVGAVWRPYVRVVREVCGHVSSCGWDQKTRLRRERQKDEQTLSPHQDPEAPYGPQSGAATGGRVRQALRERR